MPGLGGPSPPVSGTPRSRARPKAKSGSACGRSTLFRAGFADGARVDLDGAFGGYSRGRLHLGTYVAGDLFTVLVGIVFLVSGASHVACQGLAIFCISVLILMNLYFAAVASGTLLAILIAIQGVNSIIVGAGNRPLIRGFGPLAAGIGMLACAALIVSRWPESSDVSVGLWVGLALTAGGLSTVWLSWTTRHEDASP